MTRLLSIKKLIKLYRKSITGKEIRSIQKPCWKFAICMKLMLIWAKMANLKLKKSWCIFIISMTILAFITLPTLMN